MTHTNTHILTIITTPLLPEGEGGEKTGKDNSFILIGSSAFYLFIML
jgi:hypothetical protein